MSISYVSRLDVIKTDLDSPDLMTREYALKRLFSLWRDFSNDPNFITELKKMARIYPEFLQEFTSRLEVSPATKKVITESKIKKKDPLSTQNPQRVRMSPKKKSRKISKEKSNIVSKRVFIVHGHDPEMEQAVARTVEKLGLVAIVLHEKPNRGKTIIEKFTEYSDVNFAIVLLSPDDICLTNNLSNKKKVLRARQNVIFELGFFIGKLGRDKVMPLYRQKDGFELPSDYSGVLFVPFDDDDKWRFDLIQELQASGYKVDANKLLK